MNENSINSIFLPIGVLMILLGSAFFLTSLFLAVRKKIKLKRFVKTAGVVTNVEQSLGMPRHYTSPNFSSPRNTLYKPTVRFQTADGGTHDYTPVTSNSWSNYKVGEQIPVFYDPQGAEKPLIGRPFHLWFGLALFGFVGFFFAFMGAFFTLFGVMF